MFVTFSASVQGESHKRNHDKPCEDASGAFPGAVHHNGAARKTALALVADGHGGDKYLRSRFGSKLAVEAAREEIEKFIADTAEGGKGFFDSEAQTDTDKKAGHKKNLVILEKRILRAWQQKVEDHKQNKPLSAEETAFCAEKGVAIDKDGPGLDMYGTTLIAVFVTDFFWFALHIGDGACVVIHNDGRAEIAVNSDDDQGFGTTHSLCNTDAADHFRHNFGFETLLGATAASDGVTDSYSTEKYLEFTVTNLLKNLVEDTDAAKKALESEYLPMLSQKGSQDDVSLSCVFNAEAAQPLLSSITDKARDDFKTKNLERDLAQKQVELAQASADRDTWQKEAGTWKTRHAQEKDERTKAETILRATLDELNTARQENAALKGNKNLLEARFNTAKHEIVVLTRDKNMLETRLKQEEAGRKQAEADLQKANDNLDEWEEKARKYAAAYAQEKKTREKIDRELNDLKKMYEDETSNMAVKKTLGGLTSRPVNPGAVRPPSGPVKTPLAPTPAHQKTGSQNQPDNN